MLTRRQSMLLFGASALCLTDAKRAAAQAAAQVAAKAQDAIADALFSEPYIDVDEWRDAPVRHRYVHGGFKGTETRFSFYFPPKAAYRGRFFHYITPVPDSETLSQGGQGEEDKIGFAISSGAYFVETNGGGTAGMGMPGLGRDPTIGAYRANAAAARYSRLVAQKFYGGKRPYGYCFGGSGGAFRTIGGLENTSGVWDGAVPYVVGSPMAIPNMFTVRMHAMRILWDRFPQIVDATDAGGSGDIYAGLNEEERAALVEVTRMGFKPASWFGYKTMGVHGFGALYPGIVMADPGYFKDFWTLPGYLGADPPASLARARLQHRTRIKLALSRDEALSRGLPVGRMAGTAHGTADKAWQAAQEQAAKLPVAFQLADTPPDVNFLGGDLKILSGAAAGKWLQVRELAGDTVVLAGGDPRLLAQIAPGDEVQVDNSNFLAAQTYHRHQVPGRDYYVWDQFRRPDGAPIYPQRPRLLGPLFAAAASGTIQSGKFEGKMILLENLWDREALPWQADWYRTKVREHLGARFDDSFRVWFTDRALHGDLSRQEDPTRTVSYLGVLQQALRDLSAWVEQGTPPPTSTTYRVADGQIEVPSTAAARKGVQPVVSLTADGGPRAAAKVGQTVAFEAVVEVPPGTGKVVAAEWDFEGAGDFPVKAHVTPAGRVVVKASHAFAKSGTYFVTVRVASERRGDQKTPFARIQNLARARVVVA
jgi:hypothetical protein